MAPLAVAIAVLFVASAGVALSRRGAPAETSLAVSAGPSVAPSETSPTAAPSRARARKSAPAEPAAAPEVEDAVDLIVTKVPKGFEYFPTPPKEADGISRREVVRMAGDDPVHRRKVRKAGFRRGASRYWIRHPGPQVLTVHVYEFRDADGAEQVAYLENASLAATPDMSRFQVKGIPGVVAAHYEDPDQDLAGRTYVVLFRKAHRIYILSVFDGADRARTVRMIGRIATRQYRAG